MKSFFLLCLFSFAFFFAKSQNKLSQKNDSVIVIIENEPEFPGGKEGLIKFLQKNMISPKSAIKDHISGKLLVRFTVGYDGFVKDINIIKGIREDLDNSAKELIAKMPRWKPGTSDGKPVDVKVTIPLVYGSQQFSNLEFRDWVQDSLRNARQILLTNRAEFNGHSSLIGASAFLIECEGKIIAVTAKHLIGEDGGVYPPIKTLNLNSVLKEWKLFSRNGGSDTIFIDKLLNIEENKKDILFFSTNINATSIYALKVRKEPLKEREPFFVIGCQYSDNNCKQKLFKVSFYMKASGEFLFKGMKGIDLSGFSGAPVVDRDGNAIGVLIGTEKLLGANYITVQPINTILNCR